MTDQTEIDQAFARGVAQGRIENRVAGLEIRQDEAEKVLVELGDSVNATTLALKLLASDIKSRAESDKKMWEQRDRAAVDLAKALKEEKDNAAKVLKDSVDITAITLANESNKANIKFAPKLVWATYATVIVLALGAFVTYYQTYHH